MSPARNIRRHWEFWVVVIAVGLMGLFEAATGLTLGLASRDGAQGTRFLGQEGELALLAYGRPVIAAIGALALAATSLTILWLFVRQSKARYSATAILSMAVGDMWHDLQWRDDGAYILVLVPLAPLLLLWTRRTAQAFDDEGVAIRFERCLGAGVGFATLGVIMLADPVVAKGVPLVDWLSTTEPLRTHFALDYILGAVALAAGAMFFAGARYVGGVSPTSPSPPVDSSAGPGPPPS